MSAINPIETAYLESDYPVVIVRWIGTVFGKKKIKFNSRLVNAIESPIIHVPAKFEENNSKVTKKARKAVVNSVQKLVQTSRFRMCVVFGPSDCVYCDLDGSLHNLAQRPSGGARIDYVKIPQKQFSN